MIASVAGSLRLLIEPGSVAELRILNAGSKRTISGYFDDTGKMAAVAEHWSGRVPAVYLTLNPVLPDLLARASNRVIENVRVTTTDREILCRHWLPIDFDAVRPAGISSTEEEHNAALEAAIACRAFLRQQGWPDPVYGDSGNGAHLLYRVDLRTESPLVKRVLEALAAKFDNGRVHVDAAVFNPARIWKLYGTLVRKGDNVAARPHRLSKILEAPASLELVTIAQLEALAAAESSPPPAKLQREPRAPRSPAPQVIDHPSNGGSSTLNAENWLSEHGIEVLDRKPFAAGGTMYIIACPGSHGDYDKRDGKAFVVQRGNGALSAGCKHDSCSLSEKIGDGGERWKNLRAMYEPRGGLNAAREYTRSSRTATAPAPVLVENLDADPAPDLRPVAIPKETIPYPQFPLWVIEQTSIGEGLVKPECAANSKFEQFLFMAALTFQMNYLALKVRFEHAPCNMTLFLGMISPPDTLKSACVNLAADYMFQANAGLSFRKTLKTEDVGGRSILFASPGSPEGVLLRMSEIEAARAVMVYDELKHLVAKAKIESSSMESTLLAMYESGNLGASVKRQKENFAFNAGRYSFSLIWCTTSDDFLKLWARLAGDSDGLNSRMFFLPAPKQPKKLTTYREVDHKQAAKMTEDYLDIGIRRGTFKVENLGLWDEARETKRMSNRSVNLAEKFALALAVDLGRDRVDEDCQQRGLALAAYRDAAANWLNPFQAENPQADLEERIRRSLTNRGGIMRLRELERELHSNRYGLFSWWRALNGMAVHGLIAFDPETARPRCVWLGTQEDD
jgi:hypothetical protein